MTSHRREQPTPSGRDLVLWGVGEMGGVFGRAFLRAGHTVHPVRRGDDPTVVAAAIPDPALVAVTVGEADLAAVLDTMPVDWRNRVLLIQNELLPHVWRAHEIEDPTVAVVWFEKKPGRDVKVILPTPVGGPGAGTVVSALGTIDVPARQVSGPDALEDELVRKNVYILTANIAGLETRGSVGALWSDHRDLATAVASEVLAIQEHLVGHPLDPSPVISGMVEAFEGDPDHGATGRSAPARLARALRHAADAGLDVPLLRDLAGRHIEAQPA